MFTILIVEDNHAFSESLKEMLVDRFPFVTVHEAADASQAWRIVRTVIPDLIFMDIRLPDENGLEVTRKMKQEFAGVPVIIITNYDLKEYRDAARQYGADHFIPKGSSSWEEICARVESILNRSAAVSEQAL